MIHVCRSYINETSMSSTLKNIMALFITICNYDFIYKIIFLA